MYWPDISSHDLGSFHSKFKRLSRQAGRQASSCRIQALDDQAYSAIIFCKYSFIFHRRNLLNPVLLQSLHHSSTPMLVSQFTSQHTKRKHHHGSLHSLHVGQMDLFYTLFHRCLNQGGSVQHRFYFPASCIDQPSSSSEFVTFSGQAPDLGDFKLKKHITRYIILNHVTQITIILIVRIVINKNFSFYIKIQ